MATKKKTQEHNGVRPLRSLIARLLLAVSLISPAPALMTAGVATIAVTQTACGEKTLKRSAEAVKDVIGSTRDVQGAVRKAFEQNLITRDQKDRFADFLGKMLAGEEKGLDVIEVLLKSDVSVLSGSQASALNKLFDDEVIAPFLQLLTEIGKLSENSAVAIRASVATLRSVILLLSQRIGRNDVVVRLEGFNV